MVLVTIFHPDLSFMDDFVKDDFVIRFFLDVAKHFPDVFIRELADLAKVFPNFLMLVIWTLSRAKSRSTRNGSKARKSNMLPSNCRPFPACRSVPLNRAL